MSAAEMGTRVQALWAAGLKRHEVAARLGVSCATVDRYRKPEYVAAQTARAASRTVEARFWQKVNKTDGCWNWTAVLLKGYGQFGLNGKMVLAHRVAYEMLVGPIPDGLVIDHLCRNPRCVNPAHMEPVTNAENVLRGFGPAALHARQTHCLRGHEFTPENTRVYVHPGGRTRRDCRACGRLYQERRRRAAGIQPFQKAPRDEVADRRARRGGGRAA